MNTKTLLRSAALLTTGLLLVGCRAGYQVDVRNLTDQPITARLASPHPDGTSYYRAERRAGPGSRVSVDTQVSFRERVLLEVDFAGNIGYPATIDLDRGRTVVNVRRVDEGSRGQIMLEEIPRP